jgi:dynein light chain LC8-type
LKGEQAIQNIKNAMDETWEPNWHVIVGKNFGSKVTHEARRLVYFYVYDLAVLMYKA